MHELIVFFPKTLTNVIKRIHQRQMFQFCLMSDSDVCFCLVFVGGFLVPSSCQHHLLIRFFLMKSFISFYISLTNPPCYRLLSSEKIHLIKSDKG